MPALMHALPELDLIPVARVRQFREMQVARSVRFNQVIVTGPPGAGKSTFIRRLGGWPEEGYIDLTRRGWWRSQALAIRPREVHLGLPFAGRKDGLALFEPAWTEAWDRLVLDPERVRLPARKRFPLAVNWRKRFVFEFLLPAPEVIEVSRLARAREGTDPVDQMIDLAQISTQLQLLGQIAALMHTKGLKVYLRERVEDNPLQFATKPQPN
jgi:hypothetical protein